MYTATAVQILRPVDWFNEIKLRRHGDLRLNFSFIFYFYYNDLAGSSSTFFEWTSLPDFFSQFWCNLYFLEMLVKWLFWLHFLISVTFNLSTKLQICLINSTALFLMGVFWLVLIPRLNIRLVDVVPLWLKEEESNEL